MLPQPFGPQVLPVQFGAQQALPWHTWPPGHPQSPGQLPQFSPALHVLSPQETHCPVGSHVPPTQRPQTEPQPSAPHCFPVQSGMQQVPPGEQLPVMHGQSPWQRLQSSPNSHTWFPQIACGMHCPFSLQISPRPHSPQLCPQPSFPHALPSQSAAQHCWSRQATPAPHLQSIQVSQVSSGPSPHVPVPQFACPIQCPVASHCRPFGQYGPHRPPHESEPHSLPAHFGRQQLEPVQMLPGHGQSSEHVPQLSPTSHVPFPQSACGAHSPLAQVSPSGHGGQSILSPHLSETVPHFAPGVPQLTGKQLLKPPEPPPSTAPPDFS